MASAQKQYAATLRSNFGGYRPIWYPTTKIAVGDILILDQDGTFNRFGSLATYEHTKNLPVNVAKGATVPLDFVSSDGVTFAAKLSGATNVNLPNVPQASVGVALEFQQQGDFTMYAETATESYLTNVLELEQQLNRLLDQGHWDTRYVIAAKVLEIPAFTLFLSQSANTKIELTLDGTLTPSIRELGKVGVNVTTASSRGHYVKIVGAQNVTPLITGIRLEPRWFRRDRVFDEV